MYKYVCMFYTLFLLPYVIRFNMLVKFCNVTNVK